jgi:hypothetical protein
MNSEKENRPYPLHYVDIDCPKCGRHRVELYSNGKHIDSIDETLKEFINDK